jgi:hypothetical protein
VIRGGARSAEAIPRSRPILLFANRGERPKVRGNQPIDSITTEGQSSVAHDLNE